MLVTGDDDYAMMRTAEVIFDSLKYRNVLTGVLSVYLDIKRNIEWLKDRPFGSYTGSAGWTITRRNDNDEKDTSYYISIDVAEIFDHPESYNYVRQDGPYEYYKTPLIPEDEQLP